MPKGYWIARITIKDAELYKDYATKAVESVKAHGGTYLARGGDIRATEGNERPRNVIVEFPTIEAALACYNSPEYTAARAIRQAASDGEFVVIEGVEA